MGEVEGVEGVEGMTWAVEGQQQERCIHRQSLLMHKRLRETCSPTAASACLENGGSHEQLRETRQIDGAVPDSVTDDAEDMASE